MKLIISLIIILIILLLLYLYISFNKKYPLIYDYLTISEDSLINVPVNQRWLYRTECLKNFEKIKYEYLPKKYHHFNLPEKNDKIFISIASYRDPECPKTISNLFKNAKEPYKLRVVVCQQNDTSDIHVLSDVPKEYYNNIEIINMYYVNAKGPTLARFLIQQKYVNEEYYLQIDSHTRFIENWDILLKLSLNNLGYDKICLTQYPPDYQLGKGEIILKQREALNVSHICSLDGFTRVNSKYIEVKNYDKPFPCNGWGGCFSFSSGRICYDCPIDPYTPEVFFGEEMDTAIRLYTRGWNFYSPNIPVCYTNFNRDYRSTFWNRKQYNKDVTLCSRLRIHYRLGTLPNNIKLPNELLIDVEKFKLGTEKTLKDYQKLIGFNFITESKI